MLTQVVVLQRDMGESANGNVVLSCDKESGIGWVGNTKMDKEGVATYTNSC